MRPGLAACPKPSMGASRHGSVALQLATQSSLCMKTQCIDRPFVSSASPRPNSSEPICPIECDAGQRRLDADALSAVGPRVFFGQP